MMEYESIQHVNQFEIQAYLIYEIKKKKKKKKNQTYEIKNKSKNKSFTFSFRH